MFTHRIYTMSMSQRHLDAWVARSIEELKASRANVVQEPMGIARSLLQEFLRSLVERTRPLNASVLMAEATKWIDQSDFPDLKKELPSLLLAQLCNAMNTETNDQAYARITETLRSIIAITIDNPQRAHTILCENDVLGQISQEIHEKFPALKDKLANFACEEVFSQMIVKQKDSLDETSMEILDSILKDMEPKEKLFGGFDGLCHLKNDSQPKEDDSQPKSEESHVEIEVTSNGDNEPELWQGIERMRKEGNNPRLWTREETFRRMADPVNGGLKMSFFFDTMKEEENRYNEEGEEETDQFGEEFRTEGLEDLSEKLGRPVTLDDLTFWGFEHDRYYARFQLKNGQKENVRYILDHSFGETDVLWHFMETDWFKGRSGDPLRGIEWLKGSSRDIEWELYECDSFDSSAFDVATFGYDLTELDADEPWANETFTLSMRENSRGNDVYYVHANGTNQFLAGFEDDCATYQGGDGCTLVYVNQYDDIIVYHCGDVSSVVVVRYKPEEVKA